MLGCNYCSEAAGPKLAPRLQVRAGSLQELVYKQGQAGVTRASVTIVFNNKDKKGSPVGYESYDEITVCRQVRGPPQSRRP
jgi:chromosome segregation ATPase